MKSKKRKDCSSEHLYAINPKYLKMVPVKLLRTTKKQLHGVLTNITKQ